MSVQPDLVKKLVIHGVDKLLGDEVDKNSKDLYGEVLANCCESILIQYKNMLADKVTVVPTQKPAVNNETKEARVKKDVSTKDDTSKETQEEEDPVPDTSGGNSTLFKILDFCKKPGGCSAF